MVMGKRILEELNALPEKIKLIVKQNDKIKKNCQKILSEPTHFIYG